MNIKANEKRRDVEIAQLWQYNRRNYTNPIIYQQKYKSKKQLKSILHSRRYPQMSLLQSGFQQIKHKITNKKKSSL